MSTRMFTRALAPVAAAALLVLAGCGSDDTSSSASGTDHNDADVSFAQDMVPHHQQAVQMAEIAIDGASTQEVQQLAERIKDAQDPEIEQMTGWLESWNEEVSDSGDSGDMGGMDHDMDDMGMGDMGDGDMPGMMSAEQMQQLSDRAGSGVAFDRMWVTMMIAHHEGAIEMAQDQQANGQYPDAIALAQAIEDAQTAEIAEMKQLLDDWQSQG